MRPGRPIMRRCRPIDIIFGHRSPSAHRVSKASVVYSAKSRAVTVAIEAMNFRKPVFVGDLVSVHANLVRVGRTSITVHLEAWVVRRKEVHSILVTDGNFTYVAIDDQGYPQAIPRGDPPITA